MSLAPAPLCAFLFFFFNDTATTEIYTLSLHDALPIYRDEAAVALAEAGALPDVAVEHFFAQLDELGRSEEHTSELQSPCNLVCRLLLEKKKQPAAPPPPRGARAGRDCVCHAARA